MQSCIVAKFVSEAIKGVGLPFEIVEPCLICFHERKYSGGIREVLCGFAIPQSSHRDVTALARSFGRIQSEAVDGVSLLLFRVCEKRVSFAEIAYVNRFLC